MTGQSCHTIQQPLSAWCKLFLIIFFDKQKVLHFFLIFLY